MNKFINVLIERFSQESTWRGLVAILMSFGIAIEPSKSEAIISAGMFIIGTINFAKNK